jgi:uncharacterized protein (DUF1810 family)
VRGEGLPEDDPFGLERFVVAQDEGGVYRDAVDQLRRGHKTSHWMWFVFPQLAGLGHSPTSRRFAIASIAEARAYLEHPLLGPRLRQCMEILLATEGRSAEQILGPIDAIKLGSCATLFRRTVPDDPLFEAVLTRFFDGQTDQLTDDLLGARPGQ